jgi:hypothetical protein
VNLAAHGEEVFVVGEDVGMGEDNHLISTVMLGIEAKKHF